MNERLTSVKLPEDLFEEFRTASVRTKISFKQLTERTMFLFITDEEFRLKIINQFNTNISGSK